MTKAQISQDKNKYRVTAETQVLTIEAETRLETSKLKSEAMMAEAKAEGGACANLAKKRIHEQNMVKVSILQ